MWTTFRDQKGNCRMYFCGNGDWSSEKTRAACWHDRRDASAVADEYLATTPGPVSATYTYGEEFVRLPAANPKQIVPANQRRGAR